MDPQPPLYPIVIAPLQLTLKSQTYTCSGSGLMKNGYSFDSNVERYLPLLEPVRTKAGKIAVRQPQIPKQPLAYWKAQCAFRNLKQSGTLATLQLRLRNADVEMNEDLAKAESQLNEEFRKKNAAARDENWDRLETDDQKADADVDRFLRERFPSAGHSVKGPGDDDPIVLKTHNRSQLHRAASPLGLCHESVDAPLGADGTPPIVGRWIVIGRDRSAVNAEIQKISREAVRMRQRAQEAREERIRKQHETVVKNAKKSARNDAWNVAGSWTISCPYIEEQWGKGIDGCSLDIRFTESRGGRQMWAKFDFIAITGVFRFVKPTPVVASGQSKHTSSSRLSRDHGNGNDDSDDEEDEFRQSPTPEDNDDSDDEEDEFRQSPTPEEFYLGVNDKLSPSCPQWSYRWRGEETGEGVIQLYSDKKLCSITFGGPGGTELTGIFDGGFTGRIKFTGLKTSDPPRPGVHSENIDDEWNARSERAYEYARVARWH